MRKLLGILLVASLVAACATPPPGPVTGADREAPHSVAIARGSDRIAVDGDTGFTVPGFVATSPAGLIGGLIGQAIVTAIEAPAAQRRTERKLMLEGSLGETSEAATSFAASFDAALESTLREVPGLQLLSVAPTGTAGDGQPGQARITVVRDAVLSADARMVIGRATVTHLGPTPPRGNPPARREFLYFSEAIEASGDAHATAVWQAEGGRLLRDRLDQAARGLAAMVRAQLFEDPTADPQKLSSVRLVTPGAGVLAASHGASSGRPPRVPEVTRPYLLRRDAERALLLLAPLNEKMDWVWISVPASALPASGT